jgi:beta-mannosidase
VWCGHNEPVAIDPTEPGDDPVRRARLAVRRVAGMQLPTWNRTLLDRSITRALCSADGTRPVVAHSGVWPHLPKLDGTDTHTYFGWYHGDERDLPVFVGAWPRMARFVSEFGAQAVPDEADFCDPDRWPDLDWARLAERHGLQKRAFDRYVPPAAFATFAEWRAATQRYQATLVKRHVEELRRLKYRPTGGFAQFAFADGAPVVSWSVLDHRRNPKLAYHALREACAPVIVVADRLPPLLRAGDGLALDVHIVSDLRRALDDLTCVVTASWPGGAHRWRFAGGVGPDECALVGTLQIEAPDVDGTFVLDLEVTGASLPAGKVGNRDATSIRR